MIFIYCYPTCDPQINRFNYINRITNGSVVYLDSDIKK
ncbi:hypothetical protein MGWOODY_Mmi1804 [hydrothermal vent metagenome]|uniref:Uncharacterized protein n=1 Tax=hydrothermal vent metagenome TaxID=652676 RepID=A0A170QBZ8_9ZZZZ